MQNSTKNSGNYLDEEDIQAEINMTPLIDIMLVLLIIFMVSSSVNLESGLDINLPKTKGATSPAKSEDIIIAFSKAGEVSVQGKKIDFANLPAELENLLKNHATKEVIFEGDQNTSIGKMMEIMSIAKEKGALQFSVAADQE